MRPVLPLVICLLSAIAPVRAQQSAGHPLTILVPYAAGGPTDQLARQLAPALSDKLKQTVIVENVSGGGTLIATGRVARAAPDGRTLLLHNLQISANVSLYANIPFDTEKDLAPIIFINQNPLVLAGRKTLAPNTLPELIAYMKANEAKIAYPGVGSTGHLATSLFLQEAQVIGTLVPYRGAAPALQDLLGGHIDLFFATPQSVMALATGGSVKVYGITGRQNSPQFPGLESFVQALGPKLEILYWHALFAPAGTPEPIVHKINAAIQEIVDDPAMLKVWADTGVAPFPKDQRSPNAARAMLKKEIGRWGQVVRDNNIQGQM
jgi:tripartite-type tricarboxylate transporter receptor subunit TctC